MFNILFSFHKSKTYQLLKNIALPILLLGILVCILYQYEYKSHHDIYANHFYVPSTSSRFNTPWRIPNRVKLPNLKESRNRILYSPINKEMGDGLGYYVRSLSADVSTSIRLNLYYTHRETLHGTLNSTKVQSFFNLIPTDNQNTRAFSILYRNEIYQHICNNSGADNRKNSSLSSKQCYECIQVMEHNHLNISRIIQLPRNLTYDWNVYDEFTSQGANKINQFLNISENNDSNTIVQMPRQNCHKHVAAKFMGPTPLSFLFHKFWDKHGSRTHLSRQGIKRRKTISNENMINLKDDELNIAIHARRGDFFKYGRPRVSILTYNNVLVETMKIINELDDAYSSLKVVVRIYSEGYPFFENRTVDRDNEGDINAHDIRYRTNYFQDANGTIISKKYVLNLFNNSFKYKNGLKLFMKISYNTLKSIHEMALADIFIGSESTMGSIAVQAIARGSMILLPTRNSLLNNETLIWRHSLQSLFDARTGSITKPDHVKQLWYNYASFTRAAVPRSKSHKFHRSRSGSGSTLPNGQQQHPIVLNVSV